ncbi:MAG: translation elongation factor Ts [Spirochaetia bacterium]|nr:translation elongation factor Ts [Spirochaetota bacterium]MCX8097195.1 translation elongation factor Ts [Spirochaetota bacterium]MDW8112632.1 translation elongation factor Ts [Spirochaetia bacterium]
MAINMELVKQLKDRTGAGLMDCKKALEESKGDIERAVKILREKGFAAAEKKSERQANEGLIYIHIEEDKGIILEVNCETDFVARNEEFRLFVKNLAKTIFQKNITSTNDEIENSRKEAVMKFGENIVVKRWEIFKLTEGNTFDTYQHGDKLGVVVEGKIDTSDNEAIALLHDISLQVAAMGPQVVKVEDLDPSFVEEKKKEYIKEFVELGKPENIAEKAAQGKLSKLYSEICLYEQTFIKDEKGEKKVKDFINDYKKRKSRDFEIVKFYRFQIGG